MKILSLDLGQSKTAVCMLHTHDNRATHLTRPTTRQAMHDLLLEQARGPAGDGERPHRGVGVRPGPRDGH